MILGLTAVVVPQHRRALARGWRTWAVAAVIAIVLIAPWFVFATVRFRRRLLADDPGPACTSGSPSSLDPASHLWHYYLGQMFAFWESHWC